jgi:hypothetical protein
VVKVITKNFYATEFLPKAVFDRFGEAGMRYINPKIPAIMQAIRDLFGAPIRINDWFDGGTFDGRGLRLPGNPDYRQFSDHAFGNAVDFDITGLASAQVRDELLINHADMLVALGVTGIEDNTEGWVHISVSDLSRMEFPDVNGIKLIPMPK